MTKASREEQIKSGIEQLAIAWEYVDRRGKYLNVKTFSTFMGELLFTDPDDERLKEVPIEDLGNNEDPSELTNFALDTYADRKNEVDTSSKTRTLLNHRDVFSEEFNVDFNLQSGSVTWNPGDKEKVYPIILHYMKEVVTFPDTEALELLLRNIRIQENEAMVRSPGMALYYLVYFHYAVKFRLPIRFLYQKLMGNKTEERYVLPLALTTRNGYITLVAADLNDPEHLIKQFIISAITGMKSDFYNTFIDARNKGFAKPKNFNYDAYRKTAEYNFFKPARKYKILMRGFTYNHFSHSYLVDHEAEKISNGYLVSFESNDWRMVMQILFDYVDFCEVVSDDLVNNDLAMLKEDPLPEGCSDKAIICRLKSKIRQVNKLYPD